MDARLKAGHDVSTLDKESCTHPPRLRDRLVDRAGELARELVELRFADDEGRRQQDVVAAPAVDRALHGVAHEAVRHGPRLDAAREPQSGRERLLALPIGHDLQALEEAAPANVADIGMVAETGLETRPELGAHARHPGHD